MRKFFAVCLTVSCIAARAPAAAELFDPESPVQDGINVFDASGVFADIYKKLDSVKWAGKDVGIAIEALEKIHPDVHIAVTDDRAVLVWKDSIVGNWPRPPAKDWKGFGEITTAIILKLRQVVPGMAGLSDSGLYSNVVSALLRGVDEKGRYIYSKRAEIKEDSRLLTSAGLEGEQDERGNFRITGVYKNSAADNAGVREGDLIAEINGRASSEMSKADFAAALAGFNSGTLKMSVLGAAGARPVVLRRASIVMADADIVWRRETGDATAPDAGILEIAVHRVSDNSASIISEALASYGAGARGVMMDLRSATGDDERAAAKIAGLFLGKVPVLRIVETAMEETEVIPGGAPAIGNIPVVVIVSGGTAGTAEALAAAFYENRRAVLVGTPTAGAARLATSLDLENGGGLELFNREAKTGRGRKIDGRGVFPIVCLSNIRNAEHRKAFFINVFNGDFNAKDMNRDESVDPAAVRSGCPQITSGADEDALASAMAVQILMGDSRIYNSLMAESE